MATTINRVNEALSELAARVRGGLVRVIDRSGSAGSGIVWDDKGLIVTNAHVVRRSSEVGLQDGRRIPARMLAFDRGLDLAVLAVEERGPTPLPHGDSRGLRPGEWVMAMGHPWGITNATTVGTVITVGSEWEEEFLAGREWILADTHLRPGNSGGPLVDAQGRLIGVNTMTMGPSMGIAVPVHVADEFVRRGVLEPPLRRETLHRRRYAETAWI